MIAKADTMTPEEVAHFKRQIMNQIVQAKIRIYEFPDEDVLGNGETPSNKEIEANRKIKERVPFAVVGSNCLIDGADGKKIRGRKYPWGIVDVSKLYQPLFRALDVLDTLCSINYVPKVQQCKALVE